jgi:hypothetical protein
VEEKMSFDDASKQFKKYLENYDTNIKNKIESCLNRIIVDRAVYGDVHMTLATVFTKVWSYIKNHEFREELVKRLIEELEDTMGLCSSGYITRMINSLSGITDLGISISFEDQITANMGAKLNAEIIKIESEDIKSEILSEMTIPSQFYHKRLNFLNFFRQNISKIRTDMYQEFKNLISDTDFDIYTMKAIMIYQGDHMS